MGTAEVSTYLRWKRDVDGHDYAAAAGYLSIRPGDSRAAKVVTELRKLPVITRRANDILRAIGRDPLPLSDPGVLKDLKKVLSGEKLPRSWWRRAMSPTATTGSRSPTRSTRTRTSRSSSANRGRRPG